MSDEQVKGIPEDLREHYEECGKYQNAHLILCRQLIERIARSEQALAALEARNRELEGVIYDANATLCECRGANRDVHAAHRILRAALKGAPTHDRLSFGG